jgi:hypothetical protein
MVTGIKEQDEQPRKNYLTGCMIRCTLLHGNIKKPEGLCNIPYFNLSAAREKLSVTRTRKK